MEGPADALRVYLGASLARYAFPEPHPFSGDRMGAFARELARRGVPFQRGEPASCGESELRAFHTAAHVQRMREASSLGRGLLDGGDTPAFPGVYEAACAVAGTSLAAARLLLSGRARRAMNPIGGLHHARRGAAAGFCAVNDIGVVIAHLRSEGGVRRIAYVDIDAHHGDGVFYEYEADPELAIGDIHQDGRTLYPGTGFAHETGTGVAAGTKLNEPLAPGSGEAEFLEAFARIETLIEAARPEFVILQCGADSLAGDPLAGLALTPECHRHAASRLRAIADRHARGRLLALGGGGYDLRNVAAAWCAVAEALA